MFLLFTKYECGFIIFLVLFLQRFYQQYCLCYMTEDKILYHTILPDEYESDNILRTKKAHQATRKTREDTKKFYVSIV